MALRRRLRCLAAASIVGALSLSAAAEELTTAPIPRIETGMHGAAINRLAVRGADRQLVTVADDKTVRIWSLEDGALLDTLRGPIGPGPEGALYAMALSPSGNTIAVAGHTGLAWEGSAAIYFFNRESGAWIGRIGFGDIRTDAINALAFSPDGSVLAVGANDAKGLRLVDLKSNKIRLADAEYGDAIAGLDFAADGRLVTASLDGAVRLYDAAFRRVALARSLPGKPWSVAFDKTGSRVAVGFLDAAKVAVLAGSDLRSQGEHEGAGDRRGALSAVAWSADGADLYAAGTYGDSGGRKAIRAGTWRVAPPPRLPPVTTPSPTCAPSPKAASPSPPPSPRGASSAERRRRGASR